MGPIVVMHKWDLRFLKLAHHISQWSKDPSTKVGAVIVDPMTRQVLGMGYNGFPRGVEDYPERYADRDIKLRYVTHAEVNAILNANRSVQNCTLYTTPMTPCCDCAKAIIQAGISRVISIQKDMANTEAWAPMMAAADTMFQEAGVYRTVYTPEVLEQADGDMLG